MNNFYIYRYIRLDTNTPFYIGKGLSKRFRDRSSGRNQYFKNIIKTIPYEVEIMIYDLSEQEAFEKEIELIKLYKDLGYCEANLTSGGEGSSGRKMSEKTKEKLREANKNRKITDETRAKLSAASKGRPGPNKGKLSPNKGKKMSPKAKLKLSEACKGRRHTPESKLKMSKSRKRRTFTVEHKANLSKALKEHCKQYKKFQ